MSYMFILDKRKCVGCSACAVACMDQNDIDVTAGDRPFRQCFTLESGQTVWYADIRKNIPSTIPDILI